MNYDASPNYDKIIQDMKSEIEKEDEVVDWVMDWTKLSKKWRKSLTIEKDYFDNVLYGDQMKTLVNHST